MKDPYRLLDVDLSCKGGCNYCETKTTHFLLPAENKALFSGSQIEIINTCDGGISVINPGGCCFYKSGYCTGREQRPLDCRSYPGFPIMHNGKMDVELDTHCPLVREGRIPEDFKGKVLRAWIAVNPPSWWLDVYSRTV